MGMIVLELPDEDVIGPQAIKEQISNKIKKLIERYPWEEGNKGLIIRIEMPQQQGEVWDNKPIAVR